MEEVKVSVLCIAYNHEKFLRKCLDGFVMQKTNFKFEVIVHDDASTDGTKAIIEEYVEKHPDLFVPIYQTENQFSKKVQIVDNIMWPLSKGKYIALCEGDDYWCSENKLQLQYDFMESHPECSACFGNTICHDLLGNRNDFTYNNWEELHFLTDKEVFEEGLVHTTTHFVRRECFKKDPETYKYMFGDYVRKTTYFKYGKLAVLPDIMSVYNSANTEGLTYKVHNELCQEDREKEILKICEYLEYYNQVTGFKYRKEIENKIFNVELGIKFIRMNNVKTKQEFKKCVREIKNHKLFKCYLKQLSFVSRVKTFIKVNLPYWAYKMISKIKK